MLLRGQHGDPKREPQGECCGPTNFFRDCSNRLLGGNDATSTRATLASTTLAGRVTPEYLIGPGST